MPFLVIFAVTLLAVTFFSLQPIGLLGGAPQACPWWHAIEYTVDEGGNLMKGALFLDGYPLYEEIWSDQPPVFTWVLAACFQVFGVSVMVARLIVMFFSAVMLFSLFRILRRSEGLVAGIAGAFFLLFTLSFVQLSMMILIGLPSVALAIAAMDPLLLYQRDPRVRWLCLSGLLMGLSLMTKMYTLMVLPVFIGVLVYLVARHGGPGIRRRLLHILVWLLLLAAPFAYSLLQHPQVMVRSLFLPHIEMDEMAAEKSPLSAQWTTLHSWVEEDYDFQVMGLAGLLLLLMAPRLVRAIPFVWLGFAFVAFMQHRPLQFHHYAMFLPALAWAAGLGAGALWTIWRETPVQMPSGQKLPVGLVLWARWAALCVLVFFLLEAPFKAVDEYRSISVPESKSKVNTLYLSEKDMQDLTRDMRRFAPWTQWVFSDRPFDVFASGLRVPPPIAIYSSKRRTTGRLGVEELESILREYPCQQVWFRRHRHSQAEIETLLGRDYVLLQEELRFQHFVRQDLFEARLGEPAAD